ncbi:MAG: DUF1549 and DUF1553 domain-containing protein [bacterium]|nr:DUF1549 and DUF1553 domain-containing protein [bacterium]
MPKITVVIALSIIGVFSAQANDKTSIDTFLDIYLRDNPAEVPDHIFMRRAYFDIWGLPPLENEIDEFLNDHSPNKREKLIDHLLADKNNYTEHWISFWNDHLRNDEETVYHGDRASITPWLKISLENNMPYDKFVSSLLNPADNGPDGPAGFLTGVNWRGQFSPSQSPVMQAAQNSAQVFLGINLKCNSCHDSFISKWKLEDAYGLAAFFTAEDPEIYRCDISMGKKATPKFIFPELQKEPIGQTLQERREAIARLFTDRNNNNFARTIVNRIWKRLIGRGLVEPVDDVSAKSWNPELLDWLSKDFIENNYDLKFLIRRIMTSRAYQIPTTDSVESSNYIFNGPSLRKLTAEQYMDALNMITSGQNQKTTGAELDIREWRKKTTPLTQLLGRPIRDRVITGRDNQANTLQAMEIVNGKILADIIKNRAGKMADESIKSHLKPLDTAKLLYRRALCRYPNKKETKIIKKYIDAKNIKQQPEGLMEFLEDIIWTVILLPEFQFIH